MAGEIGDEGGGAAGCGVAAVGEYVHGGGDAGGGEDMCQGDAVLLVAVDAAVGDQTEEMAGAAGAAGDVDEGQEGGCFGEAAVFYGSADAGEFLTDDAAGADVQVADLGVAHLADGEADVAAAGVQEGAWSGLPEAVEVRGGCLGHGIVRLIFAPPETVENKQHDGTRDGHESSSAGIGRVLRSASTVPARPGANRGDG